MPSIDLVTFDHLVFVVLLVVVPLDGRRRFRSLLSAVDAGTTNARTRAYREVILQKWVLTALIGFAWVALGRSASSLGLVPSVSPLAVAGYILTGVAIGALLMYPRSVLRSEQALDRTRTSLASVRTFIPHTASEKRWFDLMSVTAGITEEVIYRGFLFAYLAAWLSGAPAAVIIVLAALVFGLGHLYQGAGGIVKAGLMGVIFGVLYWMTGSLWASMLLHIVVDLTSGWIGWQIIRRGGLDDRAEPALG